MRYKDFFEIKLVHPYTPNILEHLVLTPDASAISVAKKNQLLLKNTASGFKILMPINENGESVAELEVDDTLVFNMFPSSQDFFEFTDFSSITEGKAFLFTNKNLSNDSFDLLVSKAFVRGKLNGFPIIGQIEITLNSVTTGTDGVAPVYKAEYKAKSIPWKYFFISKEEPGSLTVENKDILFEKLNEEASDPVFNSLKANFKAPELQIHAFESEEPLAYQSSPRKSIHLKKNKTTLIEHLPNPDAGDHGIKIIRIN